MICKGTRLYSIKLEWVGKYRLRQSLSESITALSDKKKVIIIWTLRILVCCAFGIFQIDLRQKIPFIFNVAAFLIDFKSIQINLIDLGTTQVLILIIFTLCGMIKSKISNLKLQVFPQNTVGSHNRGFMMDSQGVDHVWIISLMNTSIFSERISKQFCLVWNEKSYQNVEHT